MTGPTITELDQRIALIRENINELVERAAAYSGAEDENRTADRIAQQGQELAKLIKLRDALLRSKPRAVRPAAVAGRRWAGTRPQIAELVADRASSAP